MRAILLFMGLFPCVVFSQSFMGAHERGWFWYEKAPEKIKKQNIPPNPQPLVFPATKAMTSLQKQVTERLNRAILYPTQENLLKYADTYYNVINQGQRFTEGYKMMLLKYPQFNYYLRFPVNHQARLIHERQFNQANQEAVKKLAMTHGLLFFYASNCQYCHAFSPTVKQFAKRYGFHVMAISMDGGSLPEFSDATYDNGIAKTLGVKSWPSLFAVNPRTRQVIPLSNGMVSISELEEIIFRYASNAQPYTS